MQRYQVLVHPEPDGGYWGEIPALEGCYSQGETIEELMLNLREAAAGVLEVMAEDGRVPGQEATILELAL